MTMTKEQLDAVATQTAGKLIRVTFTDGTDLAVVSQGRTTTKGFVYKISDEDTSVGYIARTKIEKIEVVMDTTDTTPAATPEIPADGLSTADVAAMFDMTPKELRVILRKVGAGVGKGRRYGIDADTINRVRDTIKAG